MSFERLAALVSFLPALAAWFAYPGRPWAAAAILALAVPVAAALAARAPDGLESPSLAAAAWVAAGALGAAWAARRAAARVGASAAELGEVRRRRDAAQSELSGLRREGARAEAEHKETLALYGLIKGLSEALTWEDVRPKLETAVNQYLGVTEFGLYVRAEQGFTILCMRKLEGSPGGSWDVLERTLEEQGLAALEAHLLERPEKALGLPIRDGGELLGYFYARVPPGADAAALLGKAASFASELAFAFRRVLLFQETERLSQVDGLTGVYRRGAFDERLREEAVRAKTFRTTFAVMLLDIDHFKQLNDRYGHPFGDQVLKRVGELLNGAVYETDFVARYGGEEFAVILPRAEAEGALRKAEAVRRQIESERFSLAFETIRVTISIGLAHFPRDARTPEELVACADSAMYLAKSQGRNQVVVYAVGRA